MSGNLSLRARRDIARIRKTKRLKSPTVSSGTKVFNLRWVNDTIDQIITELSAYSDREPEIAAALETMLAAKRLVQAYSDRMIDTPYKSRVKLDAFETAQGLINAIYAYLTGVQKQIQPVFNQLTVAYEHASEWAENEDIPTSIVEAVRGVGEAYDELNSELAEAGKVLRKESENVGKRSYRRASRKNRYGDFFQ